MRAAVHAVLHHQAAWNRARARDRAERGERSSWEDFGGERARRRSDLRDRPARASGTADVSHLLIVDDDPNTLASLARAFRLAGHEATVADRAARAMELVRSQTFDLIFSDVAMPEKDGIALLEEMRAAGVTTPVLMISGQATVDMAVGATRLGPIEFLEETPSTDNVLLDVENTLTLRPPDEDKLGTTA